jgi:hypothetical protein
MSEKLDFKINPSIFKDLLKIEESLPDRATGSHKAGGGEAYDRPAGLALLGEKDSEVDTIVELKMSGGCWDAPNINYTDMYKGFKALLELDRKCVGMALVRHKTYQSNSKDQGKINPHMRSQIFQMRNSFEDITKTIWIILQQSYFKIYKPTKGAEGRIGIKELVAKSLFETEVRAEEPILKSKFDHDQLIIDERMKKKKALQEIREKKRIAKEKVIEEKKRRIEEIDRKMKIEKADTIELGGGMIMMKDKEGKYILWQVS